MNTALFSAYTLGRTQLSNRIVMAPVTRNRSPGNVPGQPVARCYAQRAEPGLIVTGGTSPSRNGLGYARIPGLFNDAHVKGWRVVTDEVHAASGRIFVQLMHIGRASATANLPPGARVVAPFAVALSQPVWVDGPGNQPASLPVTMTEADIEAAIEEHAQSAELAMQADFDGVELHGASGYLVDQFLNTASNVRTDRWGGSAENRARFAVEVARRCAARVGGDRVGIRVSPYGVFNDMKPDAEMDALYAHLAKELSALGLAYVHVVDHSSIGAPEAKPAIKEVLRSTLQVTLILSGGSDNARAEADLQAGRADLVAFGRPFISNPQLPTLLRQDRPLAPPDFATFYAPGEKGYTGYPVDG
ncbi:MAG: alkene reductase [Deltaproteobacteria bacterium]|nr:alkene reductase [Deltaproteobacteria bacterium]